MNQSNGFNINESKRAKLCKSQSALVSLILSQSFQLGTPFRLGAGLAHCGCEYNRGMGTLARLLSEELPGTCQIRGNAQVTGSSEIVDT